MVDKLDNALLQVAMASLRRRDRALDADATSTADADFHPPGGRFGEVPHVLAVGGSLAVLWKPSGWIVSTGDDGLAATNQSLARRAVPALQHWVASQLGPRWSIARDMTASHGLAHRLDRETSGGLLWARSHGAHHTAQLQFAARRVRKDYICLCHGLLRQDAPLALQAPLLEVAAARGAAAQTLVSPRGRRARTEITAVGHAASPRKQDLSLVTVRLGTGRLHQIRVHLAHEGHSLAGDTVYGTRAINSAWCPRTFLHAEGLGIDIGEGPFSVAVPLPADLRRVMGQLVAVDRHTLALINKRLKV
mmetsp:Transcript_63034/g.146783  ORF Transcript_63034/g.146783 Transcript_63034/m.146783 type:complete len:306 (-) Transcript_63034:69-986(-)